MESVEEPVARCPLTLPESCTNKSSTYFVITTIDFQLCEDILQYRLDMVWSIIRSAIIGERGPPIGIPSICENVCPR
ncbi:hypothetical protein DMENIID0001_137200 [Sergentomyia squamirostris]